jgi:hypothetical protein
MNHCVRPVQQVVQDSGVADIRPTELEVLMSGYGQQ